MSVRATSGRHSATFSLSYSFEHENRAHTQVNRIIAELIMIGKHCSVGDKRGVLYQCVSTLFRSHSIRSSDTSFCLESLVVLHVARIDDKHRLETPSNEEPSDQHRAGSSRSASMIRRDFSDRFERR